MMLNPAIEKYLTALHPVQMGILAEMERLALEKNFPYVGPLVGQALQILSRISQAKKILELGSGFGYSAFWFLQGMEKEGRIICTDKKGENERLARGFFRKAGMEGRVDFRVGDALETLKATEEGPFDIIFNDIDKEDYPRALELALPKIRKGGLFVSDNVLWFGSVADSRTKEPTTLAIQKFNRMLFSNKNLLTTIVPLRDGLSVSLKL